MVVNSKTVAVLHIGVYGGGEGSSWPGLEQELGRMEKVQGGQGIAMGYSH